MKTRLFPFFLAVVIMLVLTFLVGNGRALTAEISPANQIQPDITVEKTNNANGDGEFTDDETTTAANPLSAEYRLQITNNTAEPLTITDIQDSIHDLAGSNCATLVNTQLPVGTPITCTFTGTFSQDADIVTNTASVTVEDGVAAPVT
ncbi:MAG TPA: hypothetical protein VF177_00005, partial [Anaerolineae bacterium]